MRREHYIHVTYGIMGSVSLLILYFSIIGTLQGIYYAVDRFLTLWYLMIPLVILFGVQIGLLSCFKSIMKMGSKTVAASSGASAASMIVCCAHHITDVIPFLGISAIGVFLLDYQASFLVLGIVSNVLGIMFMMNIATKNRLKSKNPFFKKLVKQDWEKLIRIAVIMGFLIIIASFILAKPLQSEKSGVIKLYPLSDSQNAVTVDVEPLEFSLSNPVKFYIKIDTHSVPLDFDLLEVSKLFADEKEFKSISWEGSPPGSHHRSGILIFSSLEYSPNNLKLVINNIAGADRIFIWKLA